MKSIGFVNISKGKFWSGATSRRTSSISTAKCEGRRAVNYYYFAFKCLKNLITFVTLTYEIILYQGKYNIIEEFTVDTRWKKLYYQLVR